MTAEEILEFVRSRSSPGILILDLKGNLLYSNPEALILFADPPKLPREVRRLCKEVQVGTADAAGISCAVVYAPDGSPCSLRAFLIGARRATELASHVMVLVEKVTEQHGIDLKKAKSLYGLSNRETEVVTLVAQGLTNKEIGGKLFLSEYTVKDHLKNIMRKMGAGSRSEIVYHLK